MSHRRITFWALLVILLLATTSMAGNLLADLSGEETPTPVPLWRRLFVAIIGVLILTVARVIIRRRQMRR